VRKKEGIKKELVKRGNGKGREKRRVVYIYVYIYYCAVIKFI